MECLGGMGGFLGGVCLVFQECHQQCFIVCDMEKTTQGRSCGTREQDCVAKDVILSNR